MPFPEITVAWKLSFVVFPSSLLLIEIVGPVAESVKISVASDGPAALREYVWPSHWNMFTCCSKSSIA